MSKSPSNPQSETQKQAYLGLYLLPRGLALLLGLEMLKLWPDLKPMYGSEGILTVELLRPQTENQLFAAHHLADRLSHILPSAINPIYLLALLYLCACLGILLGWKDKICLLALTILHHSFFLANYSWSYGVDYLAQIGLYFSLLFGGSVALKPNYQIWSKWGSLLFGIQLSAVYLFAGVGKAMGKTWWNGEAVWKAVQQPFGQVLFAIPESYHIYSTIWILLGWTTVLLETGYVLIWVNPTLRKTVVYSTIAMHVGILVSMGLTHFALLMIWYNSCVWLFPYSKLAKSIINILERSRQKGTGALL